MVRFVKRVTHGLDQGLTPEILRPPEVSQKVTVCQDGRSDRLSVGSKLQVDLQNLYDGLGSCPHAGRGRCRPLSSFQRKRYKGGQAPALGSGSGLRLCCVR